MYEYSYGLESIPSRWPNKQDKTKVKRQWPLTHSLTVRVSDPKTAFPDYCSRFSIRFFSTSTTFCQSSPKPRVLEYYFFSAPIHLILPCRGNPVSPPPPGRKTRAPVVAAWTFQWDRPQPLVTQQGQRTRYKKHGHSNVDVTVHFTGGYNSEPIIILLCFFLV
jgi:hypothetical protein